MSSNNTIIIINNQFSSKQWIRKGKKTPFQIQIGTRED